MTVDSFRIVPSSLTTGIDLAENYPVLPNSNLVPGTLVSLGDASDYQTAYAVPSAAPYDQKLFGVVSTQPGLTLDDGKGYASKPIALSGRVPVRVNGENGAIAIGDPITASSVPGVGMRATSAGRIIGYAVEAFDGNSDGTIVVFVNPGEWAPPVAETLQGQLDGLQHQINDLVGQVSGGQFSSLNISGGTSLTTLRVTGSATFEANLTVSGDTSVAKLYVGGKLISRGTIPNIIAGAALGTGGVAAEIDGTQTAGAVKLTSGSANTVRGVLAEIDVPEGFEGTPNIAMTAANEDSAALRLFYSYDKDAHKFTIRTIDTPQANTTYQFSYLLIESVTQSSP